MSSSKNQKRGGERSQVPGYGDEDTGRASASKIPSNKTTQHSGSKGRSQDPQTPTKPSQSQHTSAMTASPTKPSLKASSRPSTDAARQNIRARYISGASDTPNVDSSEDEMRTLQAKNDELARTTHYGITETRSRISDRPARIDPNPLDAGRFALQGRSGREREASRSPTKSGKAAAPSYPRDQGPPSPTKRGQISGKGEERVQMSAYEQFDREREMRGAGRESPTKQVTFTDPRLAEEERLVAYYKTKGIDYRALRQAQDEGPVQAPSEATLRAPITPNRSERSGRHEQRSQPRTPETPRRQTQRGGEREPVRTSPQVAPPPSYETPMSPPTMFDYPQEQYAGRREMGEGQESPIRSYDQENPQQARLQRAYARASGPQQLDQNAGETRPSTRYGYDGLRSSQVRPSDVNLSYEGNQPLDRPHETRSGGPRRAIEQMGVQEARPPKSKDCCNIL